MQHKTTKTLAAAVLALMLSTSAYAFEKPVLLQDQGSFFAGGIQKALQIFNISGHFDNFANGIFDVNGIVYFLSVIAVCMFLTVQSIVKRRWN